MESKGGGEDSKTLIHLDRIKMKNKSIILIEKDWTHRYLSTLNRSFSVPITGTFLALHKPVARNKTV
jgi:hypothetical protein